MDNPLYLLCAALPFCERVISIERSKYLPTHNRKVPVPRNPTTLGGHLRRRRLQLGIFQAEAARRLGVSTVSLSRWECDKTPPKSSYYPAIIGYLGYDPFGDSTLGPPQGNEHPCVAFFHDAGSEITGQSRCYRQKHRLSRLSLTCATVDDFTREL
jgi:transcriptional regulator with XRE-family HTH domain